jgi:hypothetical protein
MSQCPAGGDLVMLAASIALAISSDLSADDINLLAVLLCAIGDNLAIIAARKEGCKEHEQVII